MVKFDGNWDEKRVKDLLVTHKNRSHAETAVELTRQWDMVVTRDAVKNKYNSLIQFGNPESKEFKAPEFAKNRDYFDKTISDEGKRGKRVYFVTSAVAGCELDKEFFKSVENFCKDRSANLVVLPMRGINSKDEEYSEEVLEQLSDYFYTDYTFNSNLEAFDVALNPNQINPLTGLQRVTKKSSVIVASPKQNMDVIPVSNVGVPHLLHSTGAITSATYNTNRIGMIATEDHIVGGLIVEIEDDKIFHIRQVQAGPNGEFYDVNKKYTKKGVEKAEAEAIVLGDIHSGNEDQTAINAWHELINETKPKSVFMHDFFDARSVSHHEENNLYAKITRPEVFQLLRNELDNLAKTVKAWSSKFPGVKFFVVKSNHDEHLERYLDEGRYVKDHHNYRLALDLAIYRSDGFSPLEKYVERIYGRIKNFIWLKRDEDIKVAGVQLAAHGDKGPNGSRGTLGGTEKSYQDSITGHSHTPKIIRGAWQVGTSTKLRLPYNSGGPSSWLHASCLLYENGQKQMIISVSGKWRIS